MPEFDHTRRDVLKGLATSCLMGRTTQGAFAQERRPTKPSDPKASRFKGVYSVLPTPFTEDGGIDVKSLRRLVDLYLAAKVQGITILGVAGEASRLDDGERLQVMELVAAHVNGGLPLVVGATADGTHACIEFCKRAAGIGCSAVMVSPPRMVKLSSDAVVGHYEAIATATGVAVIVQDYPPVFGHNMEPALLLRIAGEVSLARTIKLEDAPTPLKTALLLAQSNGIPLEIMGGLGGGYLLQERMAGSSGVMTGFAYPEMLVEVDQLFVSGDIERATDAFYRYLPLIHFEAQEGVGLAIRKELLRRRGAIASAGVRAPGVRIDRSTHAAMDHVLEFMRDMQGVKWISV